MITHPIEKRQGRQGDVHPAEHEGRQTFMASSLLKLSLPLRKGLLRICSGITLSIWQWSHSNMQSDLEYVQLDVMTSLSSIRFPSILRGRSFYVRRL